MGALECKQMNNHVTPVFSWERNRELKLVPSSIIEKTQHFPDFVEHFPIIFHWPLNMQHCSEPAADRFAADGEAAKRASRFVGTG